MAVLLRGSGSCSRGCGVIAMVPVPVVLYPLKGMLVGGDIIGSSLHHEIFHFHVSLNVGHNEVIA